MILVSNCVYFLQSIGRIAFHTIVINSAKNFLQSIHYRTQDFGRLIGVDYAEGFTTERYVAVKSLGDLI